MFLPACGVTFRTSQTIPSKSVFVILSYDITATPDRSLRRLNVREEMPKSELISFHENPIDRSRETSSMFTANVGRPRL